MHGHKRGTHKQGITGMEQSLLRSAPRYTGVHKLLIQSVIEMTVLYFSFQGREQKRSAVFQWCISREELHLCLISQTDNILLLFFSRSCIIFRNSDYLLGSYLLFS